MPGDRASVRASVEVALPPPAAFEAFVDELSLALVGAGIRFDPGEDGHVVEREATVARVVAWRPGERVLLEWHPAPWEPDAVTEVELRFEPVPDGTRVTLEHRGFGGLLADHEGELAGWFAAAVAAPLLRASAPAAFGDWLTDRGARRPSGPQARATYRDPLYHLPNFRALLDLLALGPADVLLEVGCGGGRFLHDALRSGCRAAAVDHSPDMVRLAREVNREAVAGGRLAVHEASADALPFPDRSFTCAAMTGVLGFLHDPVAALGEIRRVLRPGGRVAILGSDPELRGSPAAPEPMASRLRFYDAGELERLGREAGLDDVRVELRVLEPYAREVGVPAEHLPLFAEPARFLIARRGEV